MSSLIDSTRGFNKEDFLLFFLTVTLLLVATLLLTMTDTTAATRDT
jgi:hypothetical protein